MGLPTNGATYQLPQPTPFSAPANPGFKAASRVNVGLGNGQKFAPTPSAKPNTPGEYGVPQQTETYVGQQAKLFATPTQGSQLWNQVRGQFNTPTNAQGAYDAYQAGPHESGLASAYDQAAKDTTTGINNQLAARGVLGSSAGVGMIGHALSDLRSQQAQAEGAYRLQDAQVGGQLAGAADTTGLSKLGVFSGLADSSDTGTNSRFLAGLTGARAADDQHMARGQFAINSMLGEAGIAVPTVNNGLNNIVGSDQITNDQLNELLAAMGAGRVQSAQDIAAILQNKNAAEQQGLANIASAGKLAATGGK